MRTKTLLLTAALSAAGVATSLAQGGAVYSVNAVGYVNVNLTGGAFNLVANPLDAADNTIPALFAELPAQTTIYKFDPASGFVSWLNIGGNWLGSPDASTVSVNPGEGVFIDLPEGEDVTLTFVGEVPQGDLSQEVPAGLSIQASQVPQAGGISSVLGFPAQANDTIFEFVDGAYQSSLFVSGPGWLPGEPEIAVGEAFFVQREGDGGTWSRNFDVNAQ